uniref:thioredoxin-dependent peroxiredoxin n=1 Tax=Erythrolobus australicus TaxID=1077150 RepID=A0A7S1TMK7_9RHOD|mmetsp:Transcript_4474/g.12201  ORF Transcript_4474/g.12201 Transcript_4474/m.12201 type:complete len:225 (+) Transcript_4474:19-693(+)
MENAFVSVVGESRSAATVYAPRLCAAATRARCLSAAAGSRLIATQRGGRLWNNTLLKNDACASRGLWSRSAQTVSMLSVGDIAPDFTAPDQDGKEWTLSNRAKKSNVVLYFYPKDDTPGCTKQACAFNDALDEFTGLDAEVVGVSSDKSHSAFISKYGLRFSLLSDVDSSLRKLYDVPKTLGFFPGRCTFVIDKNGVIQLKYNSLGNAAQHAVEAKKTLEALKH